MRNARIRPAALAALAALLLIPSVAVGAKYTPLEWRREVGPPVGSRHDVPRHDAPPTRLEGQRKHVGWNRDKNLNFVDDEIEARFTSRDSVDVIVELNECFSIPEITARLSGFGAVTYVGRLISCAYMKGVPFGRLDSLASLPEVAMVEWQAPYHANVGVSVRGIQATESTKYGTSAVRTSSGGATGAGVTIAIFDTAILNGNSAMPWSGSTPSGSWVAGYDATANPPVETDPTPGTSLEDHGTQVAAIALGRARSGESCRNDETETTAPDCGGVAPGAKLVEVKVCEASNNCDLKKAADGNVMQGIDWVGTKTATSPIGVANFSISDGLDCDGTCAVCQAVNYLASLGIVPVVGLGNADCSAGCSVPAGTKRVATPAAASYAITVQATNDKGSVDRGDDVLYSKNLVGPRKTPAGMAADYLGEKPDISAPGEGVWTYGKSGDFIAESGTSLAAPHVAGAAALLLETNPTLDPADLKDLLRRTADKRPLSGSATWNASYGAGLLNVYQAAQTSVLQADLTFPTCAPGGASSTGSPCPLTGGLPDWLNYIDVKTSGPLKVNSPVTITADVVNNGPNDATDVLISFGIYFFGVGTKEFHEIGTFRTNITSGGTVTASQEWTPEESGHQCIQVTIHYGYDTNYTNNRTQRNLEVSASRYDVRVENPYMVPAQFHVVPTSERSGWEARVDQTDFTIGGPEDCPKNLRVDFRPPESAQEGDSANCNVAVFARPEGRRDSVLIGGVTVKTYIPKLCTLYGRVIDTRKRPIVGAVVTFSKDLPPGAVPTRWESERSTTTKAAGAFSLPLRPGHLILSVARDQGGPPQSIPVEVECERGKLVVEWSDHGIRIVP